jgi:hypothetical protein
LLLVAVALNGCGSDDKPPAPGGPKAPSELNAAALSAAAHLTWKDNSSDEDNFMVERQQVGTDTDFKTISTLPFDTTSYHDAPLTSGATYKYKIMAMNASGESESNEATVMIP